MVAAGLEIADGETRSFAELARHGMTVLRETVRPIQAASSSRSTT